MSKPWYAFFKRAAASAAVSATLALSIGLGSVSATAAPSPVPSSLPAREILLSDRGGKLLRVGDSVAYSLRGGTDPNAESDWHIDSKVGGLKLGFLFRPGKLFTPLMAGELSLPSVPVVNAAGDLVAKTDPLVIKIESNLSEAERNTGTPPKAEPAIGPLGLPFPIWIQTAVGFALLLGVLILAYYLFRAVKRRAARALKAMLPRKPYDLAALERLDLLLKEGHLEKGNFKRFYFGISESLKFYLGERFSFDAQESTTTELMALLRERGGAPGLSESVVNRIGTLFESMDPVKFADRIPPLTEAKETHREAREIVLLTRKVVVEPIAGAVP